MVRTEEKDAIFRDCHEAEVGGGHSKRDKIHGKILEWFYWNGICDVYQRVDGKLGKQHAELHPIPVTDVWKQVSILVNLSFLLKLRVQVKLSILA